VKSTNHFWMQYAWEDSNGAQMAGSTVQQYPVTPDYQLFAFQAVTAGGEGSFRPVIRLGACPGGTVIALDDIQVYST